MFVFCGASGACISEQNDLFCETDCKKRHEMWNMKSSRHFKTQEEPRNGISHKFLTTLREFLLTASHSVHKVGKCRQTTNQIGNTLQTRRSDRIVLICTLHSSMWKRSEWEGHLAWVRRSRYIMLVGKPGRKRHFEHVAICKRKYMLKWILQSRGTFIRLPIVVIPPLTIAKRKFNVWML